VYDSDPTCGTYTGDLVKKTDAVGNIICYAHDGLHRVTSITYPSGAYAASTPNRYFVYDSATVNAVVMANPKTRLAEAYTATSATGTKITDLGFSYSVRGEISAVYEKTPNSGGYYSMTATYWANGALDQLGGLISSPPSTYMPTLTYTPDGEGRPAIITASAGQNPVTATSYNPASLPTGMTLGSSDSDSFAYDPNTNRVTQFQATVNSQSLTGTLGWNPVGTLASLSIVDALNSTDTQNCTFAHDDLIRVASASCATIWGQNFTYDAFGNISKSVQSGSNGISFQPQYSADTNRMTSLPSFTPTYDLDGNLTKDPQHQYGWNSEGRPVTIDSLALTYDALNRMVEQGTGSSFQQIVYDPLGEKFALMNGQTLTKAFAPLPDGGIAAYTSSGLAYYRHPDWLGSSRLASTPTRGIYADTAYAPFGEPYAQTGTADLSFTGQNEDTASNLYDFLFREDSPIQGRWISPDPLGLAAVSLTDPQSWNRYGYVRNSPLMLVDPLGLCLDPTAICFVSDPGCQTLPQYCTAPGGGGGSVGKIPLVFGQGITGGHTGASKLTFSQCMTANSATFSLAGLAQGAVNAVLNAAGQSSVNFQNNPYVQFFLGNSFSSVLYGSGTDAAVSAASTAPGFIQEGMGTVTTYGRRSSEIISLNIAGKGGLPQALSSASGGLQRFLGALGDVLDVVPDRLLIDGALFGAEAAYCAYTTQ
jgi:RHS repeat-associated protein